MHFTVEGEIEPPIEFECADTIASRWVSTEILKGKTYPVLPFVSDVDVVLDAGANCGAASVYFARHYPRAQVHALEPAAEPRAYLERNVAGLGNVSVYPVGLHSVTAEMPLYHGNEDSITGSVFQRSVNLDTSELVQLCSARDWAADHGIDHIDVLKLDVEGCEADVLESLVDLLPTVKVLYVEYDSRIARRRIASLMDPGHEFYLGSLLTLDQGECIYVSKSLADHPRAKPYLYEGFTQG